MSKQDSNTGGLGGLRLSEFYFCQRLFYTKKINKEIRNYKETLFFGLSLRQFICSLLAVGVAVALYFALRNVLDRETVSWLCIVGAAPIAVAGFFKYNGMTLEKFVWAWFKSEFLMAGNRVWKSENYYLSALEKEGKKR